MPPEIKSLTRDEVLTHFRAWGEPAYRVDQLLEWIYQHDARSWEAMSSLPKMLRERLGAAFSFTNLDLVRTSGSQDTTLKFLWRLGDRSLVESVLIPANPALYGEDSDRHTLCVSTQVGCAYGCKFCASGLDGWKRNLTVGEIVDQVLAIEAQLGRTPKEAAAGAPVQEVASARRGAAPASTGGRVINNLVIMGMGEPLANYESLLKALQILNAPWGGGIGARRITVSTSGLAPQIRSLAEQPQQYRLAISLHGATDAVRNQIMPVNRKYPLRELMEACSYYVGKKGRIITFEYILIAGINDHLEQVAPLARLARSVRAKVNLIPYNRVEGLPWDRPGEAQQQAFLEGLLTAGIPATLRREKGHDIDAACGQLRLRTERELAAQT